MTGFVNGYALSIGIANYLKVRPLPSMVLQDAKDLADLLISPVHCSYSSANVRLILDEQATADRIRVEMQWLAQSAGPHATVLIFFSGHGGRLEGGPNAGSYLIPYDSDPANLKTTAISGQELTALLRNIQASRLLVFFDCCYAGGAGEAKYIQLQQTGFKDGFEENYYEQLMQGNGRVIIASSRADEVSLVLPSMRNSLFTHYLLEALRGRTPARGDGLIRVFDLFDYVSEMVPMRGNQHPIFKATDLENNFPVALFLGGKTVGGETAGGVNPHQSISNRLLRELITATFTDDELSDFCFDHFPKVYDQFTGGQTKSLRVRLLTEYVQRQQRVSELLSGIQKLNPGVYAEYANQMQ